MSSIIPFYFFVIYINFRAPKNTRKDTHKSRKPFFPNWKQQKKLLNGKPLKNRKLRIFFEIFRNLFWRRSPVSRIVPKTSRNPLRSQNVSFLVKIEGGLRWKRIFKKSHKNTGLLKKRKSDIACWAWENLLLKNLTMPKTLRGALGFLTSILLQIFKKLKGDRLESFEKFSQKEQKMKNFLFSASLFLASRSRLVNCITFVLHFVKNFNNNFLITFNFHQIFLHIRDLQGFTCFSRKLPSSPPIESIIS